MTHWCMGMRVTVINENIISPSLLPYAHTCSFLAKNVNIKNSSICPTSALILAGVTHFLQNQLQICSCLRWGYLLYKNRFHNFFISQVDFFHLHFFAIILHLFQLFLATKYSAKSRLQGKKDLGQSTQ